jgi:hypothetical protein
MISIRRGGIARRGFETFQMSMRKGEGFEYTSSDEGVDGHGG